MVNKILGSDSYYIRLREKSGPGTWKYYNISGSDSIIDIKGLTSNTEYEWQVRTICVGGYLSLFTSLRSFTTLVSCPSPSNLMTDNITMTSAELKWDNVVNAKSYILRYRKSIDVTWHYITLD